MIIEQMITEITNGAISKSLREWIINAPQNKAQTMIKELDIPETGNQTSQICGLRHKVSKVG